MGNNRTQKEGSVVCMLKDIYIHTYADKAKPHIINSRLESETHNQKSSSSTTTINPSVKNIWEGKGRDSYEFHTNWILK